jgi:hypothetical protein
LYVGQAGSVVVPVEGVPAGAAAATPPITAPATPRRNAHARTHSTRNRFGVNNGQIVI